MICLTERFEIKTKEKTPCIYAILNNNNFRVYVGQSKKPNMRIQQHISGLKSGTHAKLEMQKKILIKDIEIYFLMYIYNVINNFKTTVFQEISIVKNAQKILFLTVVFAI